MLAVLQLCCCEVYVRLGILNDCCFVVHDRFNGAVGVEILIFGDGIWSIDDIVPLAFDKVVDVFI